jgi:hypothetical protein
LIEVSIEATSFMSVTENRRPRQGHIRDVRASAPGSPDALGDTDAAASDVTWIEDIVIAIQPPLHQPDRHQHQIVLILAESCPPPWAPAPRSPGRRSLHPHRLAHRIGGRTASARTVWPRMQTGAPARSSAGVKLRPSASVQFATVGTQASLVPVI